MEQFEIVARSYGCVIARKNNEQVFKPYEYIYGEGVRLYERYTANNEDMADMMLNVHLVCSMDDSEDDTPRYAVVDNYYNVEAELGTVGMLHLAEICAQYQVITLRNTARIAEYVKALYPDIADTVARERGINATDAVNYGGKRYAVKNVLRPALDRFMQRMIISEEINWQTGADGYKHNSIVYQLTSPSGEVFKTTARVIASFYNGVSVEDIYPRNDAE